MNDKKRKKLCDKMLKEYDKLLGIMGVGNPIFKQFSKYEKAMDLYRKELEK